MKSKSGRVLIVTLSQVISFVVSFLMSPYLSRSLTKEEYAAYNLAIVIITLTGLVFSIGIPNAVFAILAKINKSNNELLSTLQFLIFASGVVATIGLFCLSYAIPLILDIPHIDAYMRLCCINLLIACTYNFFISVLIFYGKVKPAALLSLLLTVLSMITIFVSFHFYHSIQWALFLSLVIVPLLFCAISFFAAKQYLAPVTKFYKKSFKEIAAISIPLYITSLLGSSYIYVSAFFISFTLGDIAYANYRNGAIEIPFISTIAYSVSAVLLPDIAKYFESNLLNEAYELKRKIMNQSIVLLYPVIFYFLVFHQEFIITYFSAKYASSAMVFAIFAITSFVRINNYQDVLITSGNAKYILKANVFYFVLNVILVVGLGYYFGINGVAVASCISVFVLAYVLLKKDASIFNKPILAFFDIKPLITISIVALLILFFSKILLSNFLKLQDVFVLMIAAAFYFPFIYIFIFKKGYLAESITDMVKRRISFLNFIPKL